MLKSRGVAHLTLLCVFVGTAWGCKDYKHSSDAGADTGTGADEDSD